MSYIVRVKSIVLPERNNTIEEIDCKDNAAMNTMVQHLRKQYPRIDGYRIQIVYWNPETNAVLVKETA